MYVTIKDYSLFQSVYSIKADMIQKNEKLQDKSFYFKYKTNILSSCFLSSVVFKSFGHFALSL